MSKMSELAIEQEEQQEQAMMELGLITITKEKLEHLLSSAFYYNDYHYSFEEWKKDNKIGEL